MARIFLISGACGCGKTTFADAYAAHMVRTENKTVYMIHGDHFQDGFVKPDDRGFFKGSGAADPVLWEDVLRFNWDCIVFAAGRALDMGLDVVVDYVVEDELPRVRDLAAAHHADLYYIVMTAASREIERRIRERGDTWLIERALFLKRKLEAMPETRGHLYDTTGKTTEEMLREIDMDKYALKEPV
ncbi:MAG: hypothetical protein IKP22_12325 [Clostridia bacterium]|nr:hypothetical protein [Clostridia bacterium]